MDGRVKDGAQKLIGMLKRRERRGKGYKHGICVGNWWLKQQGYAKDLRKEIWNVLFESGLLLRENESVWLLDSIVRMAPSFRKRILPLSVFRRFSKDTGGWFDSFPIKERKERN